MEIKSIPVPMSLFCFGTCPKYLQQAFKISQINFTENKHSIDHLPWRNSNYEDKESGGNLNESTYSNISVPTPKFCNKSTQIQIGTKHKNPIFLGENRFDGYEYVPPRREMTDITNRCNKLLSEKNTTLMKLTSLIRKLILTYQAVLLTPLHCHSLQIYQITKLRAKHF